MKNELEIKDMLEDYKRILHKMVSEPYNPNQPQLTNMFCVLTAIDVLKQVLSDNRGV